MKMAKRLLAVALAGVLAVSILTGCSGGSSGSTNKGTVETPGSSTTTPTTPETPGTTTTGDAVLDALKTANSSKYANITKIETNELNYANKTLTLLNYMFVGKPAANIDSSIFGSLANNIVVKAIIDKIVDAVNAGSVKYSWNNMVAETSVANVTQGKYGLLIHSANSLNSNNGISSANDGVLRNVLGVNENGANVGKTIEVAFVKLGDSTAKIEDNAKALDKALFVAYGSSASGKKAASVSYATVTLTGSNEKYAMLIVVS